MSVMGLLSEAFPTLDTPTVTVQTPEEAAPEENSQCLLRQAVWSGL